MPIRTRLALAVLVIIALLGVPIAIALRSLDRLHETTRGLRDQDFVGSLVLGQLRSGLEDLRAKERRFPFTTNTDSAYRDLASTVQYVSRLADSLGAYDLDTTAAEWRTAVGRIAILLERERDLIIQKDTLADVVSERDVQPAIAAVERAIGPAEATLRERTRRRVELATIASERARTTALVALALALALALLVGMLLTRAISKPIEDLDAGMRAVADGDFQHRLALGPRRNDEFARLARSFETMSEQLVQLDRLKAEFVSVASHELKTPINVILGYVQLLEEGLYGPLTPKQREICGTLAAQGTSLARLVRQLLDVSRFEAGGARLELRPVDLRLFLQELESAFQVLALQRGVSFRVSLGEALPDEVVWDQDRINEVLGNLLSNAFRFTARDGTVELSVTRTDGAVHMEVHDTGAGIPAAQLPHIFRKFFQADNQVGGAMDTTGLGLAIAKEIVDAHQGTIEVESEVGVGTTFSITLPIVVGAGRSAPSPPASVAVAGAGGS